MHAAAGTHAYTGLTHVQHAIEMRWPCIYMYSQSQSVMQFSYINNILKGHMQMPIAKWAASQMFLSQLTVSISYNTVYHVY